jgi:DNA-binding CsgD family transcriptional regulator
MITEPDKILKTYQQLLEQQALKEADLDYSVFTKHEPMLRQLAELGNSGITVFDMYKKEHIFISGNFSNLLGYPQYEIEKKGIEYLNSKVHPDDFQQLSKNAITILKFFFSLPPDEIFNYKLINEYRILNSGNTYIRFIEQHQVLELDKKGNLWLAMSIIDISPNQNKNETIKSKLYNFKTAEIIPLPENDSTKEFAVELSPREKEILQLIKDGFLSKEISDKLSISFHTVNTHRQRILEKLNAGNSMEAIAYASKLGLLD